MQVDENYGIIKIILQTKGIRILNVLGVLMNLLTFKEEVGLDAKRQFEKATLLAYYETMENDIIAFSISDIVRYMSDAGYKKPKYDKQLESLLLRKLTMRKIEGDTKLEIIPVVKQEYDRKYAGLWGKYINSNSELIDETRFCGKRGYLDQLIKQINASYKNNCYDACAVLLRRLFEVLLVLTYQHYGIEKEIQDSNGNNKMLEGIVKNAKNNTTLKLSRNKNSYDQIRNVGNNSAHSITYVATSKDIEDIRNDYRVMLDELYSKSGLL